MEGQGKEGKKGRGGALIINLGFASLAFSPFLIMPLKHIISAPTFFIYSQVLP